MRTRIPILQETFRSHIGHAPTGTESDNGVDMVTDQETPCTTAARSSTPSRQSAPSAAYGAQHRRSCRGTCDPCCRRRPTGLIVSENPRHSGNVSQTTKASQRCCFNSRKAQQLLASNFAWEIKVRAIAAALLGLTLATPSLAQTTPQTQTPNLQQRGQQLLQGLTGDQNRNSEQGAPGTYDRGRADTARRPNDNREQSDRYGNTQRS